MLSILIPVYNFDYRSLVKDLLQQTRLLSEAWEIVVADDASTQHELTELNAEMAQWEGVRFLPQKQNRGRAAIRNYLAQQARGTWLLLMDCDGRVVSADFLRQYLEATENADVVYGGICHPQALPSEECKLRYLYEKRAESRFSVSHRQQHPFKAFRTFCFMIRRDWLLRCPFDETFTDYGYEDVLFGAALDKQGARIRHIDNPLENIDIETNPVFVAKTEEALRTLHKHQSTLLPHVRLLQTVHRLRSCHMLWAVRLASCLFARPLRHNLCGKHPIVSLFNFYKLIYFTKIEAKSEKMRNFAP